MRRGYVRLWREVLEKELFKEKPYCPFGAWMWMIMEANFADKVDQFGELVRRGELHTSQPKMAEAWGWDRSKVQRFLTRLQNEQRIEQQTNSRRTKLILRNYDLYQPLGLPADCEPNNDPNREPNSETSTTERSTNKRIKGGKSSARKIFSENEIEEIVAKFGVDCAAYYIPYLQNELKNMKPVSDLLAFAVNWITKDEMQSMNFFSKHARENRAKSAEAKSRDQKQRRESIARLKGSDAPARVLSDEERQALMEKHGFKSVVPKKKKEGES